MLSFGSGNLLRITPVEPALSEPLSVPAPPAAESFNEYLQRAQTPPTNDRAPLSTVSDARQPVPDRSPAPQPPVSESKGPVDPKEPGKGPKEADPARPAAEPPKDNDASQAETSISQEEAAGQSSEEEGQKQQRPATRKTGSREQDKRKTAEELAAAVGEAVPTAAATAVLPKNQPAEAGREKTEPASPREATALAAQVVAQEDAKGTEAEKAAVKPNLAVTLIARKEKPGRRGSRKHPRAIRRKTFRAGPVRRSRPSPRRPRRRKGTDRRYQQRIKIRRCPAL